MSRLAAAPRRALFCAPLPPEFDRESGSRRIYHLIQLLRELGWTVSFVCERAPIGSPHVRHLRQLGVATYVGFDDHMETLVKTAGFDLAFFAFWYLADRHAETVRRLSPFTRVIVETVDLHWLRNARRVLGTPEGSAPGQLDRAFASEMVAELNTYARADGVLAVSAKEAELINDITGQRGLAHPVPDHDEVEPGAASFAERAGMVFVGNFRHPPNLDAVEYLCQEILPLLPADLRRRHPLRVVGNGAGGRLHELAASTEGVQVVGWVPSVVPYLQASRAAVVPLRYGAGTKRKLIQALLSGTPTVSTGVGIEGIDVEDGKHLLIAEDPAAFAGSLERLLTDRALWERLADSGRSRMLSLHGTAAPVRRSLSAALESILSRPRKSAPDTEVDGERNGAAPEGVRRAVRAVLPADSRILVVSKGDPALVDLPGYRSGHFPQAPDGGYAGFHPKDSDAAVEHLTALRTRADYLIFPSTSFWWLEHYVGFARHISSRFERVWSDESCVIYALRPNGKGAAAATRLRAATGRRAGPRIGRTT